MRHCESILELFNQRKAAESPWAVRAREVRDVYGGDVAVPVLGGPGVDEPAVANLTRMGLDQMGTRAASTMPSVTFPARNPGVKSQVARASRKRQATLGWWDANRLGLKMYRRGRWIFAYAKAPVIIRPDFTTGIPRWDLRDPLGFFEAPRVDLTDPLVDDVICAVKRSYSWLARRYPEQMAVLAKPKECPGDFAFEVLEYLDHDEQVLCVVGAADDVNPAGYGQTLPGAGVVELNRIPNRAGYCPASAPVITGLDDPRGQFDGMIGLHKMQARLMADEVIAVERDIFPDEWLVGSQTGVEPRIIQVADGRQGIVGMIADGQLRQQTHQPGYTTFPTIDRIERAMRLNGQIPAEFGGESASNIRTGRRGENVLAATIDFALQEVQQTFAAALEAENRCAIAVAKGYHDGPTSFYVNWAGAKGHIDYTPSELFDSDRNIVSYAQAGADLQGLTLTALQLAGAGAMSKRRLMELVPLVEDPEAEADAVIAESLEAALLSSVQQRAAAGELPEIDVARIMQLVRENREDLAGAVIRAQQEAQERQAALVPPNDPAAMPGMAMPGMGAEASPIIPPPEPSQENLADLLTTLRRPNMTLPMERAQTPEAVV